MKRVKLTKRLVEGSPITDTGLVLWDTEVPGFACTIIPTDKRTYFVYYRTQHGQQRKPTIGQHGVLTCDEARAIARQWLAEVARGGDPSNDKRSKRKAATMKELCQKYRTEYAAVHKKPSSFKQDERLIRNKVLPALQHTYRDGPLRMQSDPGAAVEDAQPCRGMGPAARRLQPMPARQEVRGAQA